MSRFVLAFFSEAQGMITRTIEAPNSDEALRSFFEYYIPDYSKNPEGMAWFKEDFFDPDRPLGSITEI